MSDCPGWMEIKFRQVNFDMTCPWDKHKIGKNTETEEFLKLTSNYS